MEKRPRIFTTLGFMLAALFFLAVVPGASADSIQDQIDALKTEVAKLEGQQMELKKQATEAAAALPNFSYRAGSGILMEAADKSWSLRSHLRFHHHIPFQEGKDHRGRTQGEIFARRVRPTFYYCVNNCFYEAEFATDYDGFNTRSDLQRATAYIHFDNINPWLPTLYFGADAPSDINSYTQGSSNTAAQLEYDLLRRNNGFNTGSAGNAIGLRWEDAPLSVIGIPGRARINLAAGAIGEASDGLSTGKDRKGYVAFAQIEPFTEVKNKWLSGFGVSFGAWFCNVDDRTPASGIASDDSTTVSNACSRNRVRDNGPGGRQTLFDSGTTVAAGRGTNIFLSGGLGWRVGPYVFRSVYQTMNFAGDNKNGIGTGAIGADNKAKNFLIAHELYVWSPKGFLTGSSSTPGSVLIGYHFERNDYSVGCGAGKAPCVGALAVNGGQFHRNTIRLNEWDIFYVIQRGLNLGVSWLWYDAKNLRMGDNQAYRNIKEKSRDGRVGQGADWMDIMLAFRWQF